MKKIKLISTGGTIAMGKNKIGKLVPEFSGKELVESVPGLKEICNIEVCEFSNIDSSQMTPKIMFELAQLVKKEITNPEIDGIVITHGTDTLEETAYMLDLIIDPHKPIILTGAMRGATELGTDSKVNLYQAFKVAVEEDSKERGVLVVLNNEIHTAKLLTKRHSTSLAAFRSINSGKLGEVSQYEVNYFYAVAPSPTIKTNKINDKVALIKMVSGINPSLVEFIINSGEFDGLVIEGFGSGTLPKSTVLSLEEAARQKIKVVLASRCLEGRVHNIYAVPGGNKNLEELDVIFSSDANGIKARIKLMLLLGGEYSDKEIINFFS